VNLVGRWGGGGPPKVLAETGWLRTYMFRLVKILNFLGHPGLGLQDVYPYEANILYVSYLDNKGERSGLGHSFGK